MVLRYPATHQFRTKTLHHTSPLYKLAESKPMSRRKNRIINSSDGWSNVIGKGRSPLRKPSELNKLDPWDDPISPIDYEKWLKETESSLAEKAAEIKQSELWETIKSETQKFAGIGGTKIRNVVVLGLGSLSGNTKESSLYQLALIMEICALLQSRSEQYCCYPVYVQDPAFTSTDVRFFQEERKAVVLQHPEAETHIDGETLLYAPHLEYEILQATLKYRPSLVFCNDMQNFLDTKITRGSEYLEFKDFIKDYNQFVLRNVDKHHDIGNGRAFNHSALYWHKQKPTSDVESTQGEKEVESTPSKSKRIIGSSEDGIKQVDHESLQEIVVNMKNYNIYVESPHYIDHRDRVFHLPVFPIESAKYPIQVLDYISLISNQTHQLSVRQLAKRMSTA